MRVTAKNTIFKYIYTRRFTSMNNLEKQALFNWARMIRAKTIAGKAGAVNAIANAKLYGSIKPPKHGIMDIAKSGKDTIMWDLLNTSKDPAATNQSLGILYDKAEKVIKAHGAAQGKKKFEKGLITGGAVAAAGAGAIGVGAVGAAASQHAQSTAFDPYEKAASLKDKVVMVLMPKKYLNKMTLKGAKIGAGVGVGSTAVNVGIAKAFGLDPSSKTIAGYALGTTGMGAAEGAAIGRIRAHKNIRNAKKELKEIAKKVGIGAGVVGAGAAAGAVLGPHEKKSSLEKISGMKEKVMIVMMPKKFLNKMTGQGALKGGLAGVVATAVNNEPEMLPMTVPLGVAAGAGLNRAIAHMKLNRYKKEVKGVTKKVAIGTGVAGAAGVGTALAMQKKSAFNPSELLETAGKVLKGKKEAYSTAWFHPSAITNSTAIKGAVGGAAVGGAAGYSSTGDVGGALTGAAGGAALGAAGGHMYGKKVVSKLRTQSAVGAAATLLGGGAAIAAVPAARKGAISVAKDIAETVKAKGLGGLGERATDLGTMATAKAKDIITPGSGKEMLTKKVTENIQSGAHTFNGDDRDS